MPSVSGLLEPVKEAEGSSGRFSGLSLA